VFHWPRGDAVFAGDLILGSGETTWVGEYPGCVADYLESLDRLGELEPGVIYPAHGPPVMAVQPTLDRYRAHRMSRIAQVREVLDRSPAAGIDDLVGEIYGQVPPDLAGAARRSMEVVVYHLDRGEAP
jgi:glyoxylase-like metal-dependent hydrolase (beta-lactamase superfamily II)